MADVGGWCWCVAGDGGCRSWLHAAQHHVISYIPAPDPDPASTAVSNTTLSGPYFYLLPTTGALVKKILRVSCLWLPLRTSIPISGNLIVSKHYKSASIGTLHKEEGLSANIVKNSRNFVDTFTTESNATEWHCDKSPTSCSTPMAQVSWGSTVRTRGGHGKLVTHSLESRHQCDGIHSLSLLGTYD